MSTCMALQTQKARVLTHAERIEDVPRNSGSAFQLYVGKLLEVALVVIDGPEALVSEV
jgi:hypothetical protein